MNMQGYQNRMGTQDLNGILTTKLDCTEFHISRYSTYSNLCT